MGFDLGDTYVEFNKDLVYHKKKTCGMVYSQGNFVEFKEQNEESKLITHVAILQVRICLCH